MKTSSRFSILLACGAAAYGACATDNGGDPEVPGDDTEAPTQPKTDDDTRDVNVASSLPECKAQRAVYIVGSSAGLAWFTLAWPAPAVITGFQPQYAYDDPNNAKDVSATAEHPLFARKIGNRTIWQGLGTNPQPSVFVAGANETHTNAPTSILNSPSAGNVVGQAAAIQSTLSSVIPVVVIGTAGPYVAVPGAPVAVTAATMDAAVDAFTGKVSAATLAALRPSADQVARYVPAGATTPEADFGNNLAFTANAFKLGLINTVMFPAFRDDPHSAFASGAAGPRADHLAATLDAFYTDLAAAPELSCSKAGQPIKLADNVVTIVDGDTPKNSFSNAGWPDGTPGNANLLYLRSNGFTKPGWFGQLQPGQRVNFDPATGVASSTAAVAPSTAATYSGVLYAIARGDKARVLSITSAPFDGVIK